MGRTDWRVEEQRWGGEELMADGIGARSSCQDGARRRGRKIEQRDPRGLCCRQRRTVCTDCVCRLCCISNTALAGLSVRVRILGFSAAALIASRGSLQCWVKSAPLPDVPDHLPAPTSGRGGGNEMQLDGLWLRVWAPAHPEVKRRWIEKKLNLCGN